MILTHGFFERIYVKEIWPIDFVSINYLFIYSTKIGRVFTVDMASQYNLQEGYRQESYMNLKGVIRGVSVG